MEYEWNDMLYHNQEAWDPNLERTVTRTTLSSLKQRLRNPTNGVRDIEVIVDIAKGLALIMDKIEDFENKRSSE